MKRRPSRASPGSAAPDEGEGPRFSSFSYAGEEFVVFSAPVALEIEGAFTPSETDILSAVARGMSNSAIARARGTSARTVANQIATLFGKTGASSRAELAQFASRIGSPSARTPRTR